LSRSLSVYVTQLHTNKRPETPDPGSPEDGYGHIKIFKKLLP